MPFNPTPDLPRNPAVRIFFSGLLILEPSADSQSCEVFVHRSAPNHHLTIEVRRKEKGRPDQIMMRHVGPLSLAPSRDGGPLRHGMFIQVAAGAAGVRRYDGPATAEGESFDLAIDLADAKLHGPSGGPSSGPGNDPLAVDPLGGLPSIFINDGVFYAAAKTRPDLKTKLKKGGRVIEELPPFASLIGTNIYLQDGGEVLVQWRQQGRPETLKLPKPKPEEQDVSYEIYIVNDPLFETNDPSVPVHDEFKEYYKILSVPSDEQFRLEFELPPAATSRGSTRTPCMPVTKGDGG